MSKGIQEKVLISMALTNKGLIKMASMKKAKKEMFNQIKQRVTNYALLFLLL